MVFYFLAVKSWVNEMEKIACIEIAGNRKVNLSSVESITGLMNRPAIPVRNITIKHHDGNENVADFYDNTVEEEEYISINETLGETLKRMKKGETLHTHMQRRQSVSKKKAPPVAPPPKKKNLLPQPQSQLKLQQNKEKVTTTSQQKSDKSPAADVKATAKPKRRSSKVGGDSTTTTTSDPSTSKSALTAAEPPRESERSGRRSSGTRDEETFSYQYDKEETDKSIRRLSIKNRLRDKLQTVTRRRGSRSVEFDFDPNDFFGEGSEVPDGSEGTSMDESNIQPYIAPPAHCRRPTGGDNKEDSGATKRQVEYVLNASQPSTKSCLKKSNSQKDLARKESSKSRMSQSASSLLTDQADSEKVIGIDQYGRDVVLRDSVTSVCSEDDSIQSQKVFRRSLLRWGDIDIREYKQCLGDNPACSKGVPLQLDWEYTTLGTVPLNDFEKVRGPTRDSDDSLRIPSSYRQQMMLKLGYTAADLAAVHRIKLRDQKRRIQTITRLKYLSFGERLGQMVNVFPTAQRLN